MEGGWKMAKRKTSYCDQSVPCSSIEFVTIMLKTKTKIKASNFFPVKGDREKGDMRTHGVGTVK